METQVLGLSVDSTDCLRAWADSLGGISYPLLSDFYPHGRVADLYGVLRKEGFSERAIFIIDKQGVVRYVDVHEFGEQPDNDVLFGELAKIEPGLAAQLQEGIAAERGVKAAGVALPASSVTLYCTPWCPACRRARAFLQERGIAYEEVDISRDREAAKRVKGWANGNETTPTFDVGGTIIVDYDLPKLMRALGLS